MRKLLTIENIPANKSEVVKEVAKILGKTAVWTIAGYVTIIYFGAVIEGFKEERKNLKKEK